MPGSLRVARDEMASVLPQLPTLVGQSASVSLEPRRHSQAVTKMTSASL